MRHENPQLCGPECRYRSLYEGTQASLSDMAAKQAEALGRLGRVRGGVVLALKRTFSKQFSEAERAAGRRLSEVSDEVLLAYLNAFLTSAHLHPATSGVESLRGALRSLGIEVPAGEDLETWAAHVRRSAQGGPIGDLADLFEESSSAHAPVESPVGVGARTTSPSGRRPLTPPAPPAQRVAVQESLALPAAEPLKETSLEAPVSEERYEESYPETAEPAHDPYDDMSVEESSVWEPVEDMDDLSFLFEDEGGAVAEDAPLEVEESPSRSRRNRRKKKPAGAQAERRAPEARVAESRGGESRGGEGQGEKSQESAGGTDVWANLRPTSEPPAPRPVGPVDERPRRRLLPPEEPVMESIEDLFAVEEGQEARPAVAPPAPVVPGEPHLQPPEISPVPLDAPPSQRREAAQDTSEPPLRPQLFPSMNVPKTRTRKTAKVVRTSATPPDARIFDVPPEMSEGGADLTDEMRKALLSAVCIPRPVFTSDLVAVAGSMELVSAWESECRADSDSVVRFIPPKARHRLRGSLVLPTGFLRTAATEFKRTVWGECMAKYRGGRLYELGVLLHRAGEDVVAHRCSSDLVTLNLVQERGVVGVIVVSGTDLEEDGLARAETVSSVEEFLSMRLVHLAVLSTNAETVTTLENILDEEGRSHKWAPTMPVVVGKSWEYADNQGSTTKLVLGG